MLQTKKKMDIRDRSSLRHSILIIGMLCISWVPMGQTIDIEMPQHSTFYERTIRKNAAAMPLPYYRENDIVWETTVWRTIELTELFNQYMYFPLEPEGVDGRTNLAYLIWRAISNNLIPIYEDDELKIPIDNQLFVERYTKADTIQLEIVDDEENYEYQTIITPKVFQSEEILKVKLKESWFMEKVTTDMKVRITGLSLTRNLYRENEEERELIGQVDLFWIPMLSKTVRDFLVKYEAYRRDNTAKMPSWLEIFEGRVFEAYITRSTNVQNRSISSYLTGSDAIREAERIDEMIKEITEDMWEY